MRLYVASSWRNPRYPSVIEALRKANHDVYDFREHGFGWREIDPGWQSWTPAVFRQALNHPRSAEGFDRDITALRAADACLLLMPCGRSAHLEVGIALGMNKPTVILLSDAEPELMYRAAGRVALTIEEVLEYFAGDRAIGAGDSVVHYPSGETWFVLGVNRDRGELCVAGWPASIARLNDCALKTKGAGITTQELEHRTRAFPGVWETAVIRRAAEATS